MARNLVRAGHEVTVCNRTRNRAEALAKDGAQVAETPAAAADGKEIVITMLADDRAVESTVLEPHGIMETLSPGALHLSMSTISPDLSRRLAEAHQARKQNYVSAPVFGRPEAAASGKLFIVAAGAANVLPKAQPIFEILGQRWFEIGNQPEQANAVKLFGNFLVMCVIEGLGEVFAAARKSGIDPKTVLQVLTGTLFGSPIYSNYGAILIEQKFSPPGFKLPLGLKDIRLVQDVAEKLQAPMPFSTVIRDHFDRAIASGYSELDWSALAQVIAEDAGLPKFQPK